MPDLQSLEAALRRTTNFSELVETASRWGLDEALRRPIAAVWEESVAPPGRSMSLLRVLFGEQARTPIGRLLIQPDRWALATAVLSPAQRKGVLEALQDWLLRSAPEALRADLLTADAPGLVGAARGQPLQPIPRTGERALDQWARQSGVEDLLDTPLRGFIDQLDTTSGPARRAIAVLGYFATVRSAIVGHRGASSKDLKDLQTSSRSWLMERAQEVQHGLEEETQPLSPPASPALASAFADLTTLRERLRRSTFPTPLRCLSRGTLDLSLDPVAWRYRDPRLGPTGEGVVVRLGDQGGASVHCHCFHDGPVCRHALAAVDYVRHWLSREKGSPQVLELANELSSPAWERTLSAIERRVVPPEATMPEAEEGLLVWRLKVRGQLDFELRPYLQRPKARGGWTAGAKVGFDEVANARTAWAEAEDRTAALLLAPSKGREQGAVGGALELLSRSGRIFLDGDPSAPLTVVRAPLGLLCLESKAGYRLVPAVLDCQLPEGLFHHWGDGPPKLLARLHVDRVSRRCFLIESAPGALAAQAVLLSRDTVFPREAGTAVVERLERAGLILEVPQALQGQSFPASTRPVVHLLRREGVAFRIELRVRPLPGGLAFPMGEGPARIRGTVDGVRGHAMRAFAEEIGAAEALWSKLGQPGTGNARDVEGEEALEVIQQLEALAVDGLEVVWPAVRPAFTRPAQKQDLRLSIREGRDWFGLRGQVEVEGHVLELATLLEAARARRRFVPVGKDAFVTLSQSLSAQLDALGELAFEGRNGLEVSLTAAGAMEALAPELGGVEVSVSFRDLAAQVRAAGALQPAVPQALHAELRHYQEEGFAWLARLSSWAPGACLADDMGLGKTLQALALLVHRAALGPALVVAPTSVCFNWRREAERFAPGLRILNYAEEGRDQAFGALGPGDVLVVSYGRLTRDAERFAAARFATAIFDEAQAVKNASTQRARACRDLDVGFRVALTGTPLENHLGELWSLFRVVFPGLLGSEEQFRARFWGPIERTRDPVASRGLARLVQPFLLRRTKREVATELPPRIDVNVPVSLSPAERRLYDEARLSILQELQGGTGQAADQRFAVLAALTRLRLLACHPVLHDPTWSGPTSKLTRLLELVEELRQQGHRALVFSQFTRHLELVRTALQAQGVAFQYLDGATPERERQQRVEAFQRGEGELFLISLKAGGTGLNLTAADNVIHLDPWWNPAVEDQATDRAHRIGQTRTVTVYRLLTRGTIEEQILALHGAKRELIAGVLDGSDAAARLDTDALAALLEVGSVDEGEEQEELTETVARTGGAAKEPAAIPAALQALPTAVSAVSLLAEALPTLAEDFRAWLTSTGKSASVVKSYPRAIERFVGFVQTRGIAEGAQELGPLAEAYLVAVREGTYEAPASDATLGRTALNTLARYLDDRS